MDRLWGPIEAVPEERLRVLTGGERIGPWRVEYTPGHAWHHVSYLHEPTATALVGDVCGVQIDGGPLLPPTPPPDIDLEAWHESLRTVTAWEPERVCITHFGAREDVARHVAAMHEALDAWGALAKRTDEDGSPRPSWPSCPASPRTRFGGPITGRCRRRCCGPG